MFDWVDASFHDRRKLQRFVCAEHPLRRVKLTSSEARNPETKTGIRYAAEVQGLIRDLRPRRKPPEFITLGLVGSAIGAVIYYEVFWKPTGLHQVQVYLVGTRRGMDGQGLGSGAVLRMVSDVVRASQMQPKTTEISLTASIHIRNERSKAMMRKLGWQCIEQDPNSNHERWGALIA